MSDNKVSAEITDEKVTNIKNNVTSIQTDLPFLIYLTTEQKKSMIKFGDKSVAFVNKALEFGLQNADALPKSLDLNEVAKDVKLYTQLFSIIQPMRVLMDKMESTLQQVGSESYASALIIYKNLKANKEMFEGSEGVLDELSRRFIQKAIVIEEQETAAVAK